MFFQILKREIRASHAKLLSSSRAEIPEILNSVIIIKNMHIFAHLLNSQISETIILDTTSILAWRALILRFRS